MTPIELAEAMETRASIRRQATSRKSVTEGANDRLADQLEQAATMLRQQQEWINNLQQWEKRQLDVIDSLNTQIKHLESQIYGGSTK